MSTSVVSLAADTAFAQFASAEELEQYLVRDALERYRDLFGQPVYGWWPNWDAYVDGPNAVARGGTPTPTQNDLEAAPDHSDTNNQVAGVDEGDIVETDGNYLYVLTSEEMVIIDSWPAEEMAVASRMPLVGRPVAEFLDGDRLTVLSEVGGGYWIDRPILGPWTGLQPPDGWWVPKLRVTIFDVSDRLAPSVVQATELEGVTVDSRAIGSHVYLAMRNSFVLPGPELIPVDGDEQARQPIDWTIALSESASPEFMPPYGPQSFVYETEQQYLERIAGSVLDLALPHYSSFGPDGALLESGLTVAATDIYRPGDLEDTNLTSVVVFDMASNDPGPVSSTGVPGNYVSDVYVSPGSIYLLESQWFSDGFHTGILKLDRDNTGDHVALSAVGRVPGDVLNQFSADEYHGDLRIATTIGWGTAASSGVYVLRQQGQELVIVGYVEGLAPSEQLYSVRFEENLGFLVTFQRTDPLWVVDLTDPEAPKVAGELEIPGFSQYLHIISGGYLIGIGRNADPHTGAWQEPQVSLFDVGDPANPRLLDRFTIDVGRWGWSEAFSDHHAIAYYPDEQVLTLTVTSSGRWLDLADNAYQYIPPETSLYVFKIDLPAQDSAAPVRDGHIRLLGRISHDTPIRRTVRIEDLLYSISSDTVSVHNILLEPKDEIARLYYGNRITDVGPVDFALIHDIVFGPADPWYIVRTTQDGLLTAEALRERQGVPQDAVGAASSGQAHLALYDERLRLLADSASQRIDWPTEAGATYYLRLSPLADSAPTDEPLTLRLSNLVSQEDSGWTVAGTEDDDLFVLDAEDGSVTVNGVRYPFGAEVTSFVLEGKGGNDTYVLAARNFTIDVVETAGVDTIDFSSAAGPVSLRLYQSSGELQRIDAGGNWLKLHGILENAVGTAFADVIFGNRADNRIHGGAGPDVLFGGAGDDWLYGDAGNDRLFGGIGDDWLEGGPGNDRLYGEAGHDCLFGQDGHDVLDGGPGDNLLDGGAGFNWLYGGRDRDLLLRGRSIGRFANQLGDLMIPPTADPATIDRILETWTGTAEHQDRMARTRLLLALQGWDFGPNA